MYLFFMFSAFSTENTLYRAELINGTTCDVDPAPDACVDGMLKGEIVVSMMRNEMMNFFAVEMLAIVAVM